MRGSAYSIFDRPRGTFQDSLSDDRPDRRRGITHFAIGFICAVVLLLGYWAWPFVGLHDLAADLVARDTAHLDHEVDFPRLRHSLTAQLVEAYLRSDSRAASLGTFGNTIASAIGTSMADPLVAQIINAENLVVLLNGGTITTDYGKVALATSQAALKIDQLPTSTLRAAWQGWRSAEYRLDEFSLGIPLEAPPSAQFRIHMQLLQWHWKLVGIDLPETLRTRLAQELANKQP